MQKPFIFSSVCLVISYHKDFFLKFQLKRNPYKIFLIEALFFRILMLFTYVKNINKLHVKIRLIRYYYHYHEENKLKFNYL